VILAITLILLIIAHVGFIYISRKKTKGVKKYTWKVLHGVKLYDTL
jgi:hypothetical protein